jgi:MFS family permease
MWELYAMWSSIGLFFAWVVQERGMPLWTGPMLAFATVAAGAVGCVITGEFGDRVGRTTSTIVPMAISAACCVTIGFAADGPLPVLIVIALIWGTSVVADSAQFSAAVTETAARDYVGTAVTLQTAAGFLLTLVTIQLVPLLSEAWGWRYAYIPLALGPLAGIIAMHRLRKLRILAL